MKCLLVLAVACFPLATSSANSSQVSTDNWSQSDAKVKTLTEVCDATLKSLEKFNEPFGKAQDKFPILSDTRSYIGQAWVKNRHLAAALAIISDELHFLPKLTGKQHEEFAVVLLAASLNLDTIREDAENDVNSLIQFGNVPSETSNLLALRDAIRDAHRLSRRIKNLPPDEK